MQMQTDADVSSSKNFLGKFDWIWSLWVKFGQIKAKFGQKRLDLGKIKILYPQKHSISNGNACNYKSVNE